VAIIDAGSAPSRDLYLETRARFVAAGASLGRWCREHGVHHQHARMVLIGSWTGPKGGALKRRIVEASIRLSQKVAA
jgi:hypothetical protein